MDPLSYHDFPWPSLPETVDPPVWTQNGFVVAGNLTPILCYHHRKSGWSNELTQIHEQEASQHHPIDIASRQTAIYSLKKWISISSPFILDAGCSSGFFIDALHSQLPTARPIAADYLPSTVEQLVKRLTHLPVLQFDLRECPLPTGCLDAVVALNVLEHIKEDELAIQSLFRILKKGGIAHIEVPAGRNLFDIYDEVLMHQRRYSAHDLIQKLKKAGFEILKTTHLGCFIYPAFWWTKKKNQHLKNLTFEEKQFRVRKEIRKTSSSWLLSLASRMEYILGHWISWPIGIRCVIVCQKPL